MQCMQYGNIPKETLSLSDPLYIEDIVFIVLCLGGNFVNIVDVMLGAACLVG